MKKKVWELTHASTSFMCLPPMKFKPKRGNKKSKKGEESEVHHDPSQWEYVEGSHGSQTTKRSFTKLIESQPTSHTSRLIYLSLFSFFYISTLMTFLMWVKITILVSVLLQVYLDGPKSLSLWFECS